MFVAKRSHPADVTEDGDGGLYYDFSCDKCGDLIGALDYGYAVSLDAGEPERGQRTDDLKQQKAQPVSFVHVRCLDSWLEDKAGEFRCVPLQHAIVEMALRVGRALSEAWEWDPKLRISKLGRVMGVSLKAHKKVGAVFPGSEPR